MRIILIHGVLIVSKRFGHAVLRSKIGIKSNHDGVKIEKMEKLNGYNLPDMGRCISLQRCSSN